jgi:hypothetical protein
MVQLDLGQSEVFTDRSQPRWLGEGATAENMKGGRHNTAGMQCNEMKRYVDAVVQTNEG